MDARHRLLVLLVVAACGSSAPSETCTQMVACPGGSGSYRLCTTGQGAAATCRYLTSDGTSFSCGSCANCQAATLQAAAWCSGGSDGGAACVTQTVCASSLKDCAAGQRCNTALNPPVCQALYCGAIGSACAGDSANDLCASMMCSGGVCVAPPDLGVASGSCCAPGRTGNAQGVGQSCTTNDCPVDTVCTTLATGGAHGFCTRACTTTQDCGANATCQTSGGGSSACVPTGCDPTGC